MRDAEVKHDARQERGRGEVLRMPAAKLRIERGEGDGGEEMRSADERGDGDVDEVDGLLLADRAGDLGEPRDQKRKGNQSGAEDQDRQVPRWLVDPPGAASWEDARARSKSGHARILTEDNVAGNPAKSGIGSRLEFDGQRTYYTNRRTDIQMKLSFVLLLIAVAGLAVRAQEAMPRMTSVDSFIGK